MLWTTIAPLWGLGLVCDKVLLLLRGERIIKDIGGPTSILFSNVLRAFLKMQAVIGHVVFRTDFARESGKFIISIFRRHSSLLLWTLLLFWLPLRRRGLFLILLVLTTGFLRRLHKFYRGGRKSSRFCIGVHWHLGNVTIELLWKGPSPSPLYFFGWGQKSLV